MALIGPGRAEAGQGRLPASVSAFSSPSFGWIWLSILIANSGRYCMVLVAGYQAYQLGRSPLWSSVVAMIILLPTMLVGPIAGGLSDRVNRPAQMTVGMTLAGLAPLGAALEVLAGHLDLPTIVTVVLVVGTGSAIQGPAWQAVLPGLLGPGRLLNGSLLARVALQGAELTGPALGTAVSVKAGPAAGFALCAAFYFVGAALAWRVRRVARRPAGGHRGLVTPVLDGFAYIARQRVLLLLLLFVGLHCCLTMAFNGVLPALAARSLRGGDAVFGLLLTGVGLGAVGGPLLLALLGRRLRDLPVLFASAVLSGTFLVLLGLATDLRLAMVAAVGAGASEATFMAMIYTLSQTVADEHMRGRVASSQLVLTSGAMSLFSMGWGGVAGGAGPEAALVAPGIAFVLAVACFLPLARILDVRSPALPPEAYGAGL